MPRTKPDREPPRFSGILFDRLSSHPADPPFRIAGLGDSLTYGWMVERGFFDRFIARLERTFPARRFASSNAGIPGDTAAGGRGRLGAVLDTAPDIVTVQFGLNDMSQGVSPTAFGDTLEAIARQLTAAAVLPVLVTSCPLKWAEGACVAEAFYDRIRAVAARLDIPCASLDRYWRETAGPPGRWDGLVQGDNVHPTDRGHRLMADGLFAALIAPIDKAEV